MAPRCGDHALKDIPSARRVLRARATRAAELLMKSGAVVSVDDVDPLQLKVIREVFISTRGVLLRAVDPPGSQSAPRQAYG